MYTGISPHAVGIEAKSLDQAIAAAREGRFEGLEIHAPQIIELPPGVARRQIEAAGLKAAGFGLPINFRDDAESFEEEMKLLPGMVRAAAGVGATRCFTWIMPCCDKRTRDENYAFHVERLKPVARVLGDNGCRFGLEFIGPATLRKSRKFPFIHTMDEMLGLARDVGPNVGMLVDSYHWYTSHASIADLQRLTNEQVVYVHVNDAPVGVAIDEQLDNIRALPAETGVIDIRGFLTALAAIGYDGPVVPEPFSRRLTELPSDAARAREAGESMERIFSMAKL